MMVSRSGLDNGTIIDMMDRASLLEWTHVVSYLTDGFPSVVKGEGETCFVLRLPCTLLYSTLLYRSSFCVIEGIWLAVFGTCTTSSDGVSVLLKKFLESSLVLYLDNTRA